MKLILFIQIIISYFYNATKLLRWRSGWGQECMGAKDSLGTQPHQRNTLAKSRYRIHSSVIQEKDILRCRICSGRSQNSWQAWRIATLQFDSWSQINPNLKIPAQQDIHVFFSYDQSKYLNMLGSITQYACPRHHISQEY